jgi:DNA-binding CsgD family transcriptional regulator
MDIDRLLIVLLDGLYRSAVEPDLWNQTFDTLLDVFRCQHAFLVATETRERVAPLLVTGGIDGNDRERFLTPDAIRAWAPVSANIVPGVAVGIQDVFGMNAFEHSEFYNEIVRPTRCYYSGILRGTNPDLLFDLNLCRPSRQGAFEADETELLQRLLPHFTTALGIRQRLHLSDQASVGFEELAQRIDQIAFLVDAECRPVFVNDRASRLLDLRDGLFLATGQLQAAIANQTNQLHHAVVQASDGNRAAMKHMYVSRKPPKLPLVLDIVPVWRLALSNAGLKTARVAIIVKQPDTPFIADRAALQDILKLTPRESEIAGLLATGATVEAIAQTLNLTAGTVRYNLQRIFDKADVHSQGALVALVHSFGGGREPDTCK